jgi:hypothetical protein
MKKSITLVLLAGISVSASAFPYENAVLEQYNSANSGYILITKNGDKYDVTGIYQNMTGKDDTTAKSWKGVCNASTQKDSLLSCRYIHTTGSDSSGAFEIQPTAEPNSYKIVITAYSDSHKGQPVYKLVIPAKTS